jgi:GT2 family glycosyltransferase
MPKSAKVGAVTVTYNSEKVIDAFLQCLLKQDHDDFVLYVIDNCSADSTLERVSHYQDPRIVVIANQSNVGVAEGNNQGIRAALAANCQFVLLVNNDTEFDPHLISNLYQGFQTYPCDMTVPKIMYHDRPDVIWYAGAAFSRSRGYSGPHWGVDCKDMGQFDVPRQVDYAPTCCMLLRREIFQRVGLMDTRYFLYFDDTDFCFRARRCGQKLYYLPNVRLFHKVSSLTGGRTSLVHILYTTRNHVYYLAKNLGWLHCLYYLPLYQLKIATKFLAGSLSADGFRVSQEGFWEGVRMSFSQPADEGDRLINSDVAAAKGK